VVKKAASTLGKHFTRRCVDGVEIPPKLANDARGLEPRRRVRGKSKRECVVPAEIGKRHDPKGAWL
jgi:hypothetical protein